MQTDHLRVAAIQLSSGEDKEHNIALARRLVHDAARAGAQLVALPETFDYRGDSEKITGIAEEIPGPASRALVELAQEHAIWVLGGSIHEKAPGESRPFNCSLLIDPRGTIVAKYRKIHLFDMQVEDRTILESHYYAGGDRPVVAHLNGIRVGLSICYDLRFPELYRIYAEQGVHIIPIPSSFVHYTGKAHWEVLVRARAIENQCFVVAPGQYGAGTSGVATYGNSLIIDPWGRILARGSDDREEIVHADLDLAEVERVRTRLPALKNRRL